MRFAADSLVAFALAFALVVRAIDVELLTDINKISQYWGQLTTYSENAEDHFGVQYTGLPSGCQVESVQTLQRHAQRFPTASIGDGANNKRFEEKLLNFVSENPDSSFSGALSFLNGYQMPFQSTGLLTGLGAATEFSAGVSFWNRYGRMLYNASVGQLAYDASYPDGVAREPPVLRTTSQARIANSMINWALGFFGSTFQSSPDPLFVKVTQPYTVVVITEGGAENNTLASYDSCFNDIRPGTGDLGDMILFTYIPKYLGPATARLQAYAPVGLELDTNDTYAMQSLCAYEIGFFGMSDFCSLFTEDEWAGFENTLDIAYYYDFSYGNPTGRAQGIGYVQELLARLTHSLIPVSNTSVNSTLDNSPDKFPMSQAFYADFSHDDIIISALTAMSMDYFHDPPSLTQFPPDPNRNFILSHLTPFGARLITETIGCAAEDPELLQTPRTQYHPGKNGYDQANADNKFIRMRLNNGILPLDSIRGGACVGRKDGLCKLEKFLRSQENSTALANYQYACFANYTIDNPTAGADWDGTIFA